MSKIINAVGRFSKDSRDFVKTSNHQNAHSGNYTNGSLEAEKADVITSFFGASFDEVFANLLKAKTLEEFSDVFLEAEVRIGKVEFVNAILLYWIKTEKLYIRFGYTSVESFLHDLPATCNMTRQTFYNYVAAGFILGQANYFFGIEAYKITPDIFHRNFSKLPILYGAFKHHYYQSFDELMLHFRDDTHIDFKTYVQRQKKTVLEQKVPRIKRNVKAKKPAMKKKTPIKLNSIEQDLYDEVAKGREIQFLPDANEEFVLALKRHLLEKRKEYFEKADIGKAGFTRLTTMNMPVYGDKSFFTYLPDLGKGDLLMSIVRLREVTEKITLDCIHKVLGSNLRKKDEMNFAQAYLLQKLNSDESLKEALRSRGFPSVKAFALDCLSLSQSNYKRLSKIGNNLDYLNLFDGKLDLSAPGLGEKVYFLDMAVKNHQNDLSLVVDYFNHLPSKEFRQFARDQKFSPSRDLLVDRRVCNKVKAYYDKYQSLLFSSKSVDFIGIRNSYEADVIERVLDIARRGEKLFKREYPNIPWQKEIVCIREAV